MAKTQFANAEANFIILALTEKSNYFLSFSKGSFVKHNYNK